MTEAAAPVQSASTETQATGNEQATENLTPAEIRKLKVKINGREQEIDEETVRRDYQKYASADEKLREAAQKRKDIEAFYEALERDPESILSDKRLPIDRQKLAMKWLSEQIEQEMAIPTDPKEQRLKELEEKLSQYEKRDKEVEETEKQRQHRELVESRREAIATTLSKAMELSPLSKDPETAAATLREMALHMRVCKDAGYEVTPEELASHVERRNLKTYQTLAQRLEGEDLINFFGEDVVRKIRQADLTRIKKSREVAPPETAENWESRREQPRKFYDPSEFRSR